MPCARAAVLRAGTDSGRRGSRIGLSDAARLAPPATYEFQIQLHRAAGFAAGRGGDESAVRWDQLYVVQSVRVTATVQAAAAVASPSLVPTLAPAEAVPTADAPTRVRAAAAARTGRWAPGCCGVPVPPAPHGDCVRTQLAEPATAAEVETADAGMVAYREESRISYYVQLLLFIGSMLVLAVEPADERAGRGGILSIAIAWVTFQHKLVAAFLLGMLCMNLLHMLS